MKLTFNVLFDDKNKNFDWYYLKQNTQPRILHDWV